MAVRAVTHYWSYRNFPSTRKYIRNYSITPQRSCYCSVNVSNEHKTGHIRVEPRVVTNFQVGREMKEVAGDKHLPV